MTALQVMTLQRNALNGTLPSELAELAALSFINLSYNDLSGQIPNFSSRRISSLLAENNQFTGSIPPLVARNAWYILLNDNRLGFGMKEIDTSMFEGNTKLHELHLQSNAFSGVPLPELPSGSLYYVDLSDNEFNGTIPSSYCRPSAVFLSNNLLSGKLSKVLRAGAECASTSFSITNNLLEEEFSDDYEMPETLKSLKISGNRLSGPLPPLPPSILEFYAAGNKFAGPISQKFLDSLKVGTLPPPPSDTASTGILSAPNTPKTKFNMVIESIDLSNNALKCPSNQTAFRTLFTSPKLSFLSLAHNRLACYIEFEFGAEFALSSLDLSSNAFFGPLPHLGSQIISLVVDHNQFMGSLEPLLALKRLTRLDISHNILDGDVASLASFTMPYLVSLKANNNYLTGQLKLPQMASLQLIEMSHNDLDKIPDFRSIGELMRSASLQFVNISANHRMPNVLPRIMMESGLQNSSSVSPSKFVEGVVCSQVTFEGVKYAVFQYDEDLFGYSQCFCDAKSFGSPPNRCFKCPQKGKKSCGASALETDRNWFAYDIDGYKPKDIREVLETESCIYTPEQEATLKTNCKGVRISSEQGMQLDPNIIKSILPSQCEKGSDGRLCSRCICDDESECFYQKGTTCTKCTRVLSIGQSAGLIVGLLIPAIAVLTLIMVFVLTSKRTKTTTAWEKLSIFKRTFYRLHFATSLGNISILISFVQMVSALTHWDAYFFRGLLELMNGNTEGIGILCLVPLLSRPLPALLLRLALPLIVIIMIGISVGLAELVSRNIDSIFSKTKKSTSDEDSDFEETQTDLLINNRDDGFRIEYPALALFTSVSISVVNFFYFGTALAAHEYLFSSRQAVTNIRYLQNKPWMKFNDASSLIGWSIPALVGYDLILPVAFLVLCWKVRKSFKTLEVSIYFGSIFETFSQKCFWWEIINIFRKLGVAMLLRGLPPNATQSSLIVTLFVAVLATQIRLSPWKRGVENFSDSLATALLILSLHASRVSNILNSPGIIFFVVALDAAFILFCVFAIFYNTLVGMTAYHLKLQFYASNMEDLDPNIGNFRSQDPILSDDANTVSSESDFD